MTYEKLSRAIRHYYDKGIMCRTRGRFTFRFDRASGFGSSWFPAEARTSESFRFTLWVFEDKWRNAFFVNKNYWLKSFCRENAQKKKTKSLKEKVFLPGIVLASSKRKVVDIVKSVNDAEFDSISLELIEHISQYLPNESEVKIDATWNFTVSLLKKTMFFTF